MLIKAGTTSVITYFTLRDSAAFTPETGYDVTDLDLTYIRDQAAAVKADALAHGAVTDAYTSLECIEVDATNAPGVYRVDWPDAAFAVGVPHVQLIVTGAGLDPVKRDVDLQVYGDTALGDSLNNVANVGSASHKPAESYTLTTGTQSANTFAATAPLDGVRHEHTDVGGDMDLWYQCDVGGDGVPSSVTVKGFLNGKNDDLEVEAYNWTTWDPIGILPGIAQSANETHIFDLFTSHVGTGANLGKVRIRFKAGAFTLTSATLAIDQLFVTHSIVARSVGYAEGALWFDEDASNTNTEIYVDGTADKAVSTWAAILTLRASMNIDKVHVAHGSTVTLSGNSDGLTLYGEAWTLALANQSIEGLYVSGAAVTGIGTATVTRPEFHDCVFGACTLPPCVVYTSGVGDASGTLTAGSAGQYAFIDCFSTVPGSGSPAFVFTGLGSTTGINNRRWAGGATWTLDSDCTLSHEVLAGGSTTVTTGGADVEIRGICRSVTLALSGAGTVQFVGITGLIAISGAATSTVNLYGVSTSLTDTSSGTTVVNETVSQSVVDELHTRATGLVDKTTDEFPLVYEFYDANGVYAYTLTQTLTTRTKS